MSKVRAFLSATRPRTLPASLSPVIIGTAVAARDDGLKFPAALLCAGVAIFAQIASNLANDYFDFKNGSDTAERQGPQRMSATGVLEPNTVLVGSIAFVCAACICGLGLLLFAPWWIIPVGTAIAVCVYAYSAGPFPLSRHALGDVAVLIFYGLIPVTLTYFVQVGQVTGTVWLLGAASGLLSMNILIVNNYRDVEEDRACGKNTTVVLFGREWAARTYLLDILSAAVILPGCFFSPASGIAAGLFIIWGIHLWNRLRKNDGPALNPLLGITALTVFFYSIIVCLLVGLE